MAHLDKEWKGWRERLRQKFKKHPLEIIQWEATRRCDMGCRHCGTPQEEADHQVELSTQEITSVFSQIKKEFNLENFKFVTITGGEPFVRDDLIEVIEALNSFGWITSIHTNGNFLARHPEKIPELIELGVRGIGVNLDGLEDYHDNLRDRKGHYAQVAHLLEELLKFSDILHTMVTTVVMKDNIKDLEKLWEKIKGINPHRWRLIPLEGIGRSQSSNQCLDSEDYLYLLNFIREKRTEHIGQRAVQTELGCMGWVGRHWEGWVRPYIWSCIAGRTTLGILSDGSLAACAQIDHAFIQGNVRTDNIKNVWESRYEVFRRRPRQEMCRKCPEKNFCTLPIHKLDESGKLRECVFNLIQNGGEKNGGETTKSAD